MDAMNDRTLIDGDTGQLIEAIEPARLLLPGGEHRTITVEAGCTVAQLLGAVPPELHPYVQAFNHGARITDWDNFHLREGDRVLLAVVPGGGKGGGKQIVGAILMIAVAIFAPYAAGAMYTAAGGTLVAANAGLIIGGLTVGITMVGAMVISALIAPPAVSTDQKSIASASPSSYMLTGQSNQARIYQPCMTVYGMYKVMPALAANPNVDNFATSSRISALYDFGLGYVNVYDLRIGDVSMWDYNPQTVLHTNDYATDLQLLPNRVGYDQYAFVMKRYQPVTVRTKANTVGMALDIEFPRGIFQASSLWGNLPWSADFVAYWRLADTGTWQEVPIDFYSGGDRAYTTATLGISYGVPGMFEDTQYNPSTSPADLRAKSAQWKASQTYQAYAVYNASRANPYVVFTYTGGPIDEGNYFARYPEIRAVGWTKSALEHFESIGSREGRDPGVPGVLYRRTFYAVTGDMPYVPTSSPGDLHGYDIIMFGATADEGGAGWIFTSSLPGGNPPLTTHPTPWVWTITDTSTWDPNVYLARYPDVAAAGFDAWAHFTNNGAYEGRDPYISSIRSVRMTANQVGVYWMRIEMNFATPGTYELQVMRTDVIEDGTDTSIANTTQGAISARFSESTIGILRSFEPGWPVQARLRHTMLELRVVATDKLQGVVQNLSAICVSVLPVTNDGANFWYQETRNPAWIALDILTSEKNPKPLARSQIDWPSWLHLVQVCAELRYMVVNGAPYIGPRYTCDIVVDATSTVKTLVDSILSACRASLVLTTAGTWGVLVDEEKTTPRQLITPANSWGFSGARTFAQVPHALRVNFITNANNAYTKDEVLVYWDGYDASNATIFETLDTYGVTDYPHAWAYGRYMMAQGIMRSELFTLSMDVENLLVQRGDLVYVAHDVPMIGGMPCRIVYVQDAPGLAVLVDRPLSIAPTGYAIRLSDGTMRTGPVYTDASLDEQWIVLDTLAGVAPDDLIVLGDYRRETQPYLVQGIAPGTDLSAELTLCRYDARVYQADQGALPPWDPGFGRDYINGTDLRSFNMYAAQTLYYVARMPFVEVEVRWTTTGWNLDHNEVSVILPNGTRVAIGRGLQDCKWTLDAIADRGAYFDIPLQLEALPINDTGYQGQPAYCWITLVPDRTAPPAVSVFGVNVQKETVDITWQAPQAPDIGGYVLKYSPQTVYPNWDSAQDLASYDWPVVHASAGARTGSYGLRVYDTSGNVSTVTWRRTTVAFLPDINVITVLNDAMLNPPWPGVLSHAVVVGSEVMTEGDWGMVYPDATYFCSYPVDLGDVYEARVSSKIEAYGMCEDDLMVNWVPSLAELTAMSHSEATGNYWNAWLEVRVANDMQFMKDWVPSISAIDPIADAADASWSPWRPCLTVGDFTGRIFQFRIQMQSRNPGVKAVVRSGRIEVDMPDRIDSYGDVAVPAAGIDFEFPMAFRSLEAVAITIDGNPDPVFAQVSNKQPTGFHLALLNTQTQALTSGQVDIMVQGYGRRGLTSI
jgi:hypothetical protein